MSYVDVFGGSPVQTADTSYRAVALVANETLDWPLTSASSAHPVARVMDITPASAGYSIYMPAGSEGPLGFDVLFRNLGAHDVTLLGSAGSSIATLSASQSIYVYLSANTTTEGVWSSLLFGAGSSSLSAGSVASPSVVSITNTLNQAHPIVTKSAAYTVAVGDRGYMVVWTGGADTLSFTSAATLGNGFFVIIRNSGTGALTLDPTSSELIDGASTKAINAGESCAVICDGSAFYTYGYGRSTTFAYTKLTKSVAGSSNVTLSASEYANGVMEFTGLLTGNIEVIFPTAINVYYIKNSTTGSFTLTCKTAAGTGVAVLQGTQSTVFCDGTNIVLAQTGAGAGTVTSVASGTGLTGGPIATTGTLSIANTGVTAGAYPVLGVTVNAQGQLTSTDENSSRNSAVWYF
jgi:hypothetical protein